LASDAAVAVGLLVSKSVALGAEATAEDFEDALDQAIDNPGIDAVVAVYIPPLNVTGEEVANVLAAVGEQSDKPLVSTFLGAEGVPELLRVPDVAGATAGRGSVPSYPAVEAAVRALARVVEYATWRSAPISAVEVLQVDSAAGKRLVEQILSESPQGRDLTHEELRCLLAAYQIDLWDTLPVVSQREAIIAGRELGWNVILKATTDHLRHRPDLAHVWRNIGSPAEMRVAWASLCERITDPGNAGFVVQQSSSPGVPIMIGSLEDPLFGPVVSFGISGPLTELLADKAYRIPPLENRDAGAMVHEIKSAPMLFGYRGSEPVDTDAIEHLIRLVAQLKNDIPHVRSLDLSLVLAGESGLSVLTAAGRVERVTDPRSDTFVRRLDTLSAELEAD
jgi:acyl-CoA synthetase (NDP forming)